MCIRDRLTQSAIEPSAERYFSSFVVVFSLCEGKNDNSWSYAGALFRIATPHILPAAAWSYAGALFRIATPHVSPAAAWDVPIFGVRCVRATRGHTAPSKMLSTTLPQAQHANGVSPKQIKVVCYTDMPANLGLLAG